MHVGSFRSVYTVKEQCAFGAASAEVLADSIRNTDYSAASAKLFRDFCLQQNNDVLQAITAV